MDALRDCAPAVHLRWCQGHPRTGKSRDRVGKEPLDAWHPGL